MEWNWLQSLVFGLLSGFCEFLPVSAGAHQHLFAWLTGAGGELLGFRLICRIFVLLALIFSCMPQLRRLFRESRIAAAPRKRRKRQPERSTMMLLRSLRIAAVPMLLSFVLYFAAEQLFCQPWVLALLLALNGLLLFLPLFFRSGNKEAMSMSSLDSLLIGFGGALSVIPGISRVGMLTSVGRLRGLDGQYAADLALLLCIPAFAVLTGLDVYGLTAGQTALSVHLLLPYIISGIAAFAGALLSILLVRFLAVKVGFAGFAYYCWGAALLILVLYLSI